MTYRGEVKSGVIIIEGGISLPEGTTVHIAPVAITETTSAGPEDSIFEMSDLAADTGVTDLASNIDHYLYDHPKASNGD